MSTPKIGADPEVFLWDRSTKNYISAAGHFPGTKKEPFKVDKGAIQVDGVALEFNIDAASSEDEFLKNISTVHGIMEKMVKDVNPDWEIRHSPYAEFSVKEWDTVPEESKVLGCDPDYNCATGTVNPNPTDMIVRNARAKGVGAIRTASGHIHIGFCGDDVMDKDDPLHFEDCRFVANYFSGRGWLRPATNEEYSRLNYYGNWGAFRPKSYGVELRSSSNRWLGPNHLISEQTVRKAYSNTMRIFQDMEAKYA
jgi:hypothetical protein